MNARHKSLLFLATTLTTSAILIYRYLQKKKSQRTRYLQCRNLSDFEELAKKILKPHRYYYYSYKAGEGHTYDACREYFSKQLRIIPRVLIDVREISLKTKIFGLEYSNPLIVGPTTFHCLAHPEGEVATSEGTSNAQSCYTYNWMYSTKWEEEILRTKGPKFLHVYLTIPKETLERIVQKAESNGYLAIVITCDHATDRVRDDVLPLFEEASRTTDRALLKEMPMPNIKAGDIVAKQETSPSNDPSTWKSIEWIQQRTNLPIICKGILSLIDVQLAIDHHVNGIIVSNHGGRQVDTAPPAIECLEEIVQLVNGRLEVFVDSGIRSGTDVLKCLALGAKAVFLGRPILYGLACGGRDGVQRVLEILKKELTYDMGSCGVTSIEQINAKILTKKRSLLSSE